MSGWDEGAIYYSDQAQSLGGDGSGGLGDSSASASHHSVLQKLKEFLRNFGADKNAFPYRESLKSNSKYLLVDLEDLHAFDADLPAKLRSSPADYLPLVHTIFQINQSPSIFHSRFPAFRSQCILYLFIYFGFVVVV